MNTGALKTFAQAARNLLIDQVTSKLDLVLAEAAPARREHPQAVKDLENAIRKADRKQVIEQVAYTWFNRFTALRFMDANGYTQVRVVSPADGATRPEILTEALAGNIPEGAPGGIGALLDGRTPSNDPQGEAYRLLLVHACNGWHKHMPFLFEKIDDYTELLMPEDLLSQSSILAELRKVMTDDACQDVEIIGWLYQFYISEKKDQVFAGLKKNQKITAENIPAATQLFTPHWIVRYLVENSLGRLWLLNRPGSKLAERMDYYIAPEEPETDFLEVGKPEEIKVCDPACGSGHMLTYAFDLLYAIYEEEGYDATEIPTLILTHNLTGVEIDDRAGALAAFALAMKAAERLGRRRFLRMEAKPDICVLQNVSFTDAEMQDVAAVVGRDLFTDELRETLGQFEQAKNFGSLIVPKLRDPAETLRVVEARDFGGDLLLKEVQARVVAVLRMAEALSPKYHVVVANPPYVARRNMNGELGNYLTKAYSACKADTFAAFIYRCTKVCLSGGYNSIMSPNVWMYISTHEQLRSYIIKKNSILTLAELPLGGFEGATVQVCAFVVRVGVLQCSKSYFVKLLGAKSAQGKIADTAAKAIRHADQSILIAFHQRHFLKIPGSPIAYWISSKTQSAFASALRMSDVATVTNGLFTCDNNRFVRCWHEVREEDFDLKCDSINKTEKRWYPYNKGGDFRKFFGNSGDVVNFKNNGEEVRNFRVEKGQSHSTPGQKFYFERSISWTFISSSKFGVRYYPEGFVFDIAGSSLFPIRDDFSTVLFYLTSPVAHHFLKCLNPSMNFQAGNISSLPFVEAAPRKASWRLVDLSQNDWDAYETSWDFTTLPLLSPDHCGETLEESYNTLRAHWQAMTDEMQRLEEENNRIFIDAYGLQDELTPEVPIEEITLTCNPAYRYGVKNSEDDRETRLRADTMAEFLSYAVGCMFGRYSLDEPGLILANQGERLEDYLARVPEPTFTPDADNVIPVLDENWFPDDIVERFRVLLRTTFGEAHFRENLKFIEDSLGKDIRKYFTRDFYAAHVQRYKKRPIYWMFSSPKGTFQALIYMHRYRPDTVSVLLNDYLREFITKLEGERTRLDKLADDPTATQGQRTKAVKDAAKLATQIDELHEWEREVVFPLAQQKIEIDLDDGVKANYPKFGTALKKIPGLS